MQKKYPEIEAEIENIYQKKLADIEIAPPADMWERINTSMNKKPSRSGFIFPWKKNTIISISVIFLLAILCATLYFTNSEKENPAYNATPASGTKGKTDKESLPEKINTEEFNNTGSSEHKHSINSKNPTTITADTAMVSDNKNNHPTIVADTIIPTKETNSTVTEEIKQKEKKSFKDKYKQRLQDSTRELFVPQK